jgi:Ca-activated chloride channel family protein
MGKHAVLVKLAGVALGLALSAGMAAPVLAQDAQGESYTAQVVQVDTSNFPEVSVWVSVTDAQGNPVRTLPPSAFSLSENGQPVEIKQVYQAGEQGPVTTVLAIDRSGSMNDVGKLAAAKEAATAYVDLMRPEDSAGIVAFNTEVDVVQPITHDKAALDQAIDGITAYNDTAMYDALAASADLLKGVDGRRAIIVLSDGLDNRSTHTAQDILATLDQIQVSVYAVGLGDPSLGTSSTSGINEDSLRAIADKSHGTYTFEPDPAALSQLYAQTSQRLQNEYRLTYISPSPLYNGVRRDIQVQVSQGAVTTQTGYNPGGVLPETATSLPWPIFGALLAGLVVLLILPDAIRAVTGARRPGGQRRGKSRVKLIDEAPKKGKKAASGKPRVHLHDREA